MPKFANARSGGNIPTANSSPTGAGEPGGTATLAMSPLTSWPRLAISTTISVPTAIRKGPPDGVPLITREGDQTQAQLSPDGRWLAYVSNETGRNEVFVAPFRYDAASGHASVGDCVPVSDGGGFAPRWRGDGKALFYLKGDGSVMTVDIHATSGTAPASATRLFSAAGVFPEWGITYDGSRLLFAVPTGPPPPLQIIQNWPSLLPD
jgi:hypothetical protein